MVGPPAQDRKLVFCHIPKTAGVTVRALIGMNFRVGEILHVRDPLDFIENARADELGSYKFIHGHFGIEIADLFPVVPKLITFLRDPLQRVLSYYRFLRSFDPDQVYEDEAAAHRVRLANELDLEGFVQSEDRSVDNGMTNRYVTFLSGAKQGMSDAERLAAAKHNLDRFEFVGITERMDESLQLLSASFGWCSPHQGPILNRSNQDPIVLNEAVAAMIRERNRLDTELYAHAVERFENDYRAMVQRLLDREFKNDSRAMVQRLLDREFESQIEAHPERLGTPPFSMVGPIQGRGWYERESDSSGAVWRASGPLAESTIYLPRRPSENELLAVTVFAVSDDVLASLRFRVNGEARVPELLEYSPRGHRYGVLLASDQHPPSRTWRIDFVVDETLRPVDIVEGNPDYRELGIAVSELDLIPSKSMRWIRHGFWLRRLRHRFRLRRFRHGFRLRKAPMNF